MSALLNHADHPLIGASAKIAAPVTRARELGFVEHARALDRATINVGAFMRGTVTREFTLGQIAEARAALAAIEAILRDGSAQTISEKSHA